MSEAVARYLRALYETTAAGERPARLLDAMDALPRIGAWVGLHAMSQAVRAPLPELDSFLPAWTERLRAHQGEWHGEDASRLLAEAVALQRGSAGLADLAREPGPRRPDVYLDWIDLLISDGDTEAAASACREALANIGPVGEKRARVAECLADLAEAGSDVAGVIEARREAWRARPTTERLVGVVQAGTRDEVLAKKRTSSPPATTAGWPGRC